MIYGDRPTDRLRVCCAAWEVVEGNQVPSSTHSFWLLRLIGRGSSISSINSCSMGGNNIVSLVPNNIIDHGVWFISSPIDMNDVRSQTD